jgi:hypothetical protein
MGFRYLVIPPHNLSYIHYCSGLPEEYSSTNNMKYQGINKNSINYISNIQSHVIAQTVIC